MAAKTESRTSARKKGIAAGRSNVPARRAMPLQGPARFVMMKKAAGVADDKKNARIGGRVSAKLVRLARKKTGLRSDSDLIEAGLLTLATEDEFGRWLVAQSGRLDKDLDLGL